MEVYAQTSALLFLDAPQNLEFGIDYNVWKTGPKFKGLKGIPPGVHFVYYNIASHSATSFRSGFFIHCLKDTVLHNT